MSRVKEAGVRPSPPVSAERHAEAVRLVDHYQGLWLNSSGEVSLLRDTLKAIEGRVEDIALGAFFDLKMWKNDEVLKAQVGEARFAEMTARAQGRLDAARRIWPTISNRNLDVVLDEADKIDEKTRHSPFS